MSSSRHSGIFGSFHIPSQEALVSPPLPAGVCAHLKKQNKEDYGVACNFPTRGELIYEAVVRASVLPVMEERGGGASAGTVARRRANDQ